MSLVTAHLVPAAGVILASFMFLTPVAAVREAWAARVLGALNPWVVACVWLNCLGWVLYSFATRDPYLFSANLPGLVGSLWALLRVHTLACLEPLSPPQRSGGSAWWRLSLPAQIEMAACCSVI